MWTGSTGNEKALFSVPYVLLDHRTGDEDLMAVTPRGAPNKNYPCLVLSATASFQGVVSVGEVKGPLYRTFAVFGRDRHKEGAVRTGNGMADALATDYNNKQGKRTKKNCIIPIITRIAAANLQHDERVRTQTFFRPKSSPSCHDRPGKAYGPTARLARYLSPHCRLGDRLH